jgi:hypothetical protein
MSEYIAAFIAAHEISVSITRSRGSQVSPDGVEYNAYVLSMTRADTGQVWENIPWMQGYGVESVPDDTPALVLEALLQEATGYDNADGFEDWAREYGYDLDDEAAIARAEATYTACGAILTAVREWAGDEAERLMYGRD